MYKYKENVRISWLVGCMGNKSTQNVIFAILPAELVSHTDWYSSVPPTDWKYDSRHGCQVPRKVGLSTKNMATS
jgi:hypothetical protein